MKNRNQKQEAWSQNKVHLATRKMMTRFIMLLAIVFIIPAGAIYAMGDKQSGEIAATITIASVGLMASIGNINDVGASDKAGKLVKAKMWVISEESYDDSQPFPSRSGRERGTIPLKAGEYWKYIRAVEDSPEPLSSGEASDGNASIKNTLTFIVGGLDDKLQQLLEEGLDKGFYIIWEICATNSKYLGGNGCKPMKLTKFEGGAGKDRTGYTLTFENQCGELYSLYTGTIQTESPDTVPADETEITLTSNCAYQLTDGSVSAVVITGFDGVTSADVGRIISIYGSGGTYPSTITAANDFILTDGTTWTASTGKRIDVKIFKDGASSYKFIEVGRV